MTELSCAARPLDVLRVRSAFNNLNQIMSGLRFARDI